MENHNAGFKIVLTADRTLMSEYSGGIFLGFSACVPKGLIPDKLYFSLLYYLVLPSPSYYSSFSSPTAHCKL